MTLLVGLTGGIGSGKSRVGSFFKKLGVPVLEADHVSRSLTEPGTVWFDKIVAHFGQEILTPEGHLNRRALRAIIFKDSEEKKWLEALLHPPILATLFAKAESLSEEPYVVLDIPLLLELGLSHRVDWVLVVDADESIRLSRVTQRDNSDPMLVHKIMSEQIDPAIRLKEADWVLYNNGSEADLEQQVLDFHEHIMKIK